MLLFYSIPTEKLRKLLFSGGKENLTLADHGLSSKVIFHINFLLIKSIQVYKFSFLSTSW